MSRGAIPDQMLEQLIQIGKRVLAETDVHRVLKTAMDGALEITGAERGMIILFGADEEIQFETARNLKKEDIDNPKFEISRTIIDRVKANRRPICMQNALEESTLQKSASALRLKILSVICLPLEHNKKIYGVVYLDNRTLEGAFDEKIFEFAVSFTDFISIAAYHALEWRSIQKKRRILEQELRSKYDFDGIIGCSPKMLDVLEIISQVADTDAPVLIEGETGTGKELVARALHYNSGRHELPLVSINCGAIPDNLLESELFGHMKGAFTGAFKTRKGKFEQAERGTIFLDEVDEMSPALQVKLLRILQWGEFSPLGSDEEKTCDVRCVVAAKQNLKQLVDDGKFRDDLYYRLNLIRIVIPPLRERKEDILPLAHHFLNSASEKLSKPIETFSPEVEQVLMHHNFTGNVRELENIVRRAVILCKGNKIETQHLPTEMLAGSGENLKPSTSSVNKNFQEEKNKIIEDFERQYLEKMLKECNGVIKHAAQKSGINESNLHAKLKKYGIDARDFRSHKNLDGMNKMNRMK